MRELNLEDQVSLTGLVPLEEVATLMASIDAGVVPKRTNSFGNEAMSTKIREFMAMGVPIIAARATWWNFRVGIRRGAGCDDSGIHGGRCPAWEA